MFSLAIATLTNAFNNGFLNGFLFIKIKLVQKYLAKSPAMSKGRMKRQCTGIRSTQPRDIDMITYHILTKANPITTVKPQHVMPEGANIIPHNDADTVNNIFYFAALVDKQKIMMYTDARGALSAIYLDEHQHFFVAAAMILTTSLHNLSPM